MTIEEAARQLKAMYLKGMAQREAAAAVHLFGIMFAESIDGMPLQELAVRAGISKAYGTEIRKGINLARHVRPIRPTY